MLDSTTKRQPKKPYPSFPLFPHATRRWAKKVNGKFCYYGKVDLDADDFGAGAALAEFEVHRDADYAGRPRKTKATALTVVKLCDEFMVAKRQSLDSGELSVGTWDDYHRTCRKIIDALGRDVPVDSLVPADFARLRAAMAETLGPLSLTVAIQKVRSVFKFGYDERLIPAPVHFGSRFCGAPRRVLRRDRKPRLFTQEELQAILGAVSINMRAMALLAINAAYGNRDCGVLQFADLDLDRGWVFQRRNKTGIDRRCPLWPETVDAIRLAIEHRRQPADPADTSTVFLTHRGQRYVRYDGEGKKADTLSFEFKKQIRKLGIIRPGLVFYGLRHTHRTIADETGDFPACRAIMGHVDNSIDDTYRETISDDRLRVVAAHVHGWLYGEVAR